MNPPGRFVLQSDFQPSGDQPAAIQSLLKGIQSGDKNQVLLGVTGSGKTFTCANVIARLQRPTLVITPNKVLAAQMYAEFKSLFPANAVEYFISYYDYYQPEAYVPSSDTYIEKDAAINDRIDRLRLKATTSLLERNDVIVVASVSCIYGLGAPKEYLELCVKLEKGAAVSRKSLIDDLLRVRYERNDVEFVRSRFRVRGDTVEIFPAYLETAVRVEMEEDRIQRIREFDPLTGDTICERDRVFVYPAKHFVTTEPRLEEGIAAIERELAERLAELRGNGKLLESQRLEQRTRFDLELLRETGFCHGIENYSRPLSGRPPGSRPFCLMDYFPKDHLLIIDESHVTVPQINGMYNGDRSRKQVLVDYGFRLPSAMDNRPLTFEEFENMRPQTLYMSATPGPYELQLARGAVIDQVIRPTGLVDPEVIVRPIKDQLPDLMGRVAETIQRGERTLVTTLTKRLAEDLAAYLSDKKIRSRYLHSDIDALERVKILMALRKGEFDVLVGINLLREGLDLPEVGLVAILDADKEGFLRSDTSLIQVCGRAARNVNGRVVFYADTVTGSMRRALGEMERRRVKQLRYNQEHGITPRTIQKSLQELSEFESEARRTGIELMREQTSLEKLSPRNASAWVEELTRRMREAADQLDFETAALLRDQLLEIQEMSGSTKGKRHGRKTPHA